VTAPTTEPAADPALVLAKTEAARPSKKAAAKKRPVNRPTLSKAAFVDSGLVDTDLVDTDLSPTAEEGISEVSTSSTAASEVTEPHLTPSSDELQSTTPSELSFDKEPSSEEVPTLAKPTAKKTTAKKTASKKAPAKKPAAKKPVPEKVVAEKVVAGEGAPQEATAETHSKDAAVKDAAIREVSAVSSAPTEPTIAAPISAEPASVEIPEAVRQEEGLALEIFTSELDASLIPDPAIPGGLTEEALFSQAADVPSSAETASERAMSPGISWSATSESPFNLDDEDGPGDQVAVETISAPIEFSITDHVIEAPDHGEPASSEVRAPEALTQETAPHGAAPEKTGSGESLDADDLALAELLLGNTSNAHALRLEHLQEAFNTLHTRAHELAHHVSSEAALAPWGAADTPTRRAVRGTLLPADPQPSRALAVSKTFVKSLFFVVLSVLAVSVSSYMVRYNDESVAARLATWGRDHKLGPVVDQLEQWRYSRAPAASSVTELPITPGTPATSPASSTYSPAPLKTVATPAISGEGEWLVEASAKGQPSIWVTSNRPLLEAPSVTATYALIDQTHLVAGMWNGPEVPGHRGFERFGRISQQFVPWLTAAFNGGFRREHTNGGYFTEGQEIWPMVSGMATLAIDSLGKIHVGAYGEEIKPAGMVSMRQNVHLLVQNGRSAIGEKDYEYGAWKDGNLFIMRSGLCERTDGKLLYMVMGRADARQFARAQIDASCQTGMQLDVNAAWPKFSVFKSSTPANGLTPVVSGHKIDSRITGDPDMFIKWAPKDFFAFFTDDMPPQVQAGLK
jgi:hypothetical protein